MLNPGHVPLIDLPLNLLAYTTGYVIKVDVRSSAHYEPHFVNDTTVEATLRVHVNDLPSSLFSVIQLP